MPTSLSRENVLECVREEQFGFRFAKPQRPDDKSLLCLLPIVRIGVGGRAYITYPELMDKEKYPITEQVIAKDSGSINKMNIKNGSKECVFLRSGTIFSGKTQERVLVRSTVVYPGKEIAVEVQCVHASRPISRDAKVEYGGLTPLGLDQLNYRSGYRVGDQGDTWRNVRAMAMSMMKCSNPRDVERQESAYGDLRGEWNEQLGSFTCDQPRSEAGIHTRMATASMRIGASDPIRETFTTARPMADNLAGAMAGFSASFDSVIKSIKAVDDQVGFAAVTDRGVQTVEVFDIPASWEAIHKDAVKRLGVELLRKDDDDTFEYKADNAIVQVKKVLAMPFKSSTIFEHRPSNGEPHLLVSALEAQGYVGEVVELAGQVIHAVILKSAA